MITLKKEISKNIKLVYDHEESFIDRFYDQAGEAPESVYEFYMGSHHHFVIFEFEDGSLYETRPLNSEFESWVNSVAKGE